MSNHKFDMVAFNAACDYRINELLKEYHMPRTTNLRFQRRHYEAFALLMQETHPREYYQTEEGGVIGERFDPDYPIRLNQWAWIRQRMEALFIQDNFRFDRSRFGYACEPGHNVQSRTAYLKEED